MYQKPTLERFGTVRELTLLGMGECGGFMQPACPTTLTSETRTS